MKSKRSLSVPLIMLGTMTLSGCDMPPDSASEDLEIAQSFYTSKEDCEKDWSEDPSLCKTDPAAPQQVASNDHGGEHASGGGGGFIFLNNSSSAQSAPQRWAGPRYYWDRSIDKPVVVHDNGNMQVMKNSSISHGPSAHATAHTSTHYASVSRGGFGGGHSSSFGG